MPLNTEIPNIPVFSCRNYSADSVLKRTAGEKKASQGLFGRLLLPDKSPGQETLRCTDGILRWRSGSF